ncbi:MAG: phosphatase PAP2 family protein [Labilithrix sp.]|nr:phosphatase PAP2 family protein [Labilithrix sp.]MCW5810920.1 phosphatase PAP2 family protein [Labilithrix sp.]
MEIVTTAAPGGIDEILASDLVDDPSRAAAREPARARATARRRRRWGEQAALAASSALALGVFIGLSRAIARRSALVFDERVVRAVGRARGPVANVVGRGVTFFGGVPGASLVTATALVLARKRPRLAAQVMTGAVGGIVAELGMKRFFRRKRPTLLAHLEDVGSTSFPSGHAMASASLYLTLAFVASRSRALRDKRAHLLAATSGLALSISASRVFLGVHWPTDVLGGFALGTAWACLTEAAFDLTAAELIDEELSRASLPAPASPLRR